MLATKGDIMGSWHVEFQYPYVDLREPPKLTDKGIQIMLKVRLRGFSTKFLVEEGGLAFGDNFCFPSGTESDGVDSCLG